MQNRDKNDWHNRFENRRDRQCRKQRAGEHLRAIPSNFILTKFIAAFSMFYCLKEM